MVVKQTKVYSGRGANIVMQSSEYWNEPNLENGLFLFGIGLATQHHQRAGDLSDASE